MTAAQEQAAAAVAKAFAPEKVSEFVKAIDKTATAMQRWPVIDQLVAELAPIPSPPAEVDDALGPCDDWAEILMHAAALVHVRASSFRCLGYTTLSSGRARCGRCGWGMSARIADVGTLGSARFAQAALARVGQTIALAVGEVVQALFEAVLAW